MTPEELAIQAEIQAEVVRLMQAQNELLRQQVERLEENAKTLEILEQAEDTKK